MESQDRRQHYWCTEKERDWKQTWYAPEIYDWVLSWHSPTDEPLTSFKYQVDQVLKKQTKTATENVLMWTTAMSFGKYDTDNSEALLSQIWECHKWAFYRRSIPSLEVRSPLFTVLWLNMSLVVTWCFLDRAEIHGEFSQYCLYIISRSYRNTWYMSTNRF